MAFRGLVVVCSWVASRLLSMSCVLAEVSLLMLLFFRCITRGLRACSAGLFCGGIPGCSMQVKYSGILRFILSATVLLPGVLYFFLTTRLSLRSNSL